MSHEEALLKLVMRGEITPEQYKAGIEKAHNSPTGVLKVPPGMQRGPSEVSSSVAGIPPQIINSALHLTRAIPAFANGRPKAGTVESLKAVDNVQQPLALMGLPAAAAAPVAAAKGLVGSIGGAKLAGYLSKNTGGDEDTQFIAEHAGGAAGGLLGLSGVNAPKLSPAEEAALAWQQREAARSAKALEVKKYSTDLPVKATTKANTKEDVGLARKDSLEANRRLQEEANRVKVQERNGYSQKQAEYSMDLHQNALDVDKAQTALDDAKRNLSMHESEMTAAEKAAKRDSIAQLQDSVTKLKTQNVDLRRGKVPGTELVMKPEDAEVAKAANDKRILSKSNTVGDVRSGATDVDFEHPPDVLEKHDSLKGSVQDASDQLAAAQQRGDSLTQQKLAHKAEYGGVGGNKVDSKFYEDADRALQAVTDAQAKARAARLDHTNMLDTISQMQKDMLDLDPGPAPEVPVSRGEKLKKAAVMAGLPIAGELVGKAVGQPGLGTGAGVLADILMAARQKSSPRLVTPSTPINTPAPGYLAQALGNKLGPGAGEGLGAGQAAVPDFLRQLLMQQSQEQEQAPPQQ